MTAAATSRDRRFAAGLSLGVGVVILGLKMGAWLITGSATILSDALESVVHVAAVGFMFFAVRLAEQPADANHPYGHGRIESLSIGFEGGAILLAGLGIIWQAIPGLLGPQPLERLELGITLIGVAAGINLALGWYLLAVGRRSRSPILVADGHHVLSDVWTSAGVLGGVAILRFIPDETLRSRIDAIIAIILALVIMWTGTRLVRQAVAGLLDEADTALLAQVVSAINQIREPDWLDLHNLRCRTAGDQVHIDCHLMVPAEWTIARGHDAMDRIEAHILASLGRPGTVLIHLDYPHGPHGHGPAAAGAPFTVPSATRTVGNAASSVLRSS